MPELKIKPAFIVGQKVFLITDADQYERVVTAIIITHNGLMYEVRYGDEDHSVHYVSEISDTKIK